MSGPAPGRTGGGPPLIIGVLAVGGLVVMFLAIIIVTLAGPPDGAPAASPSIRPAGAAAQQTAGDVTRALGASSIQVVQPPTPYRPAETPSLFDAPRLVLQAVLADDPSGGLMLVYELPDAARAATVGGEYAAYLGSGVGRVQFTGDTRFVLRRVGSTLVFFAWSPATSPDPRTADVAAALASLGEAIPIPS